jgi:hypothetical protein
MEGRVRSVSQSAPSVVKPGHWADAMLRSASDMKRNVFTCGCGRALSSCACIQEPQAMDATVLSARVCTRVQGIYGHDGRTCTPVLASHHHMLVVLCCFRK